MKDWQDILIICFASIFTNSNPFLLQIAGWAIVFSLIRYYKTHRWGGKRKW